MHYLIIRNIIGIVLVMSISLSAHALELYEDITTNQVFTKPGPNRLKLGVYAKVIEEPAAASAIKQENDEKPKAEAGEAAPKAMQTAETSKAATDGNGAEKQASKEQKAIPASVSYGKNGFEFKTDNGLYSLAIQNRMQFRFATPFDRDPRSIDDLTREGTDSFMIRRARTKLKGHIMWPWLKYYFQYDWSQPVMRDLSLTVDKYAWAKLWFGRGKVFYNDERLTSSGNQQFVNRSIVNDLFTVDRQQGLQLYGNLFPGIWHDLSYYAGVFSGLGVGERNNDDDNMMWSGRLQWNAMGGEMPFSQSDVEYHPQTRA